MTDGNPTMATVLKVAAALGYHLELVADPDTTAGRRIAPRTQADRARKLG